MFRVENCVSTCANHNYGSAGQNGGSLTETVATRAGVPLGSVMIGHDRHLSAVGVTKCCRCIDATTKIVNNDNYCTTTTTT